MAAQYKENNMHSADAFTQQSSHKANVNKAGAILYDGASHHASGP